jgi:hypothetical protein
MRTTNCPGFRIARATEAVIKQYMRAYDCASEKDGQRNWGQYARALEKAGANKLIVHHIDQLRELHRNPISHPEATLTQSEAVALHAMCQSVILAMVGDMESKRANPDPTIADMMPISAGPIQISPTMLGWGTVDDAPLPCDWSASGT